MDATRAVGAILVAIGLLAGLALVAQPFFPALDVASATMGLLFLGCLSAGTALCAGRQRALRLTGGALVVLGLAALLGIFADATGLFTAARSTGALWLLAPFCLAGGLLLGYFAGALDRLAGKAR